MRGRGVETKKIRNSGGILKKLKFGIQVGAEKIGIRGTRVRKKIEIRGTGGVKILSVPAPLHIFKWKSPKIKCLFSKQSTDLHLHLKLIQMEGG